MFLQIIRFYSYRPRLFWHFWCSQVHSRTLGDLFLRPQTPAAAPSASASRCLGRTCSGSALDLQVLSGSKINIKSWKFYGGILPPNSQPVALPPYPQRGMWPLTTAEASRTICCLAPDRAPPAKILATPLDSHAHIRSILAQNSTPKLKV